MAGVLFAASPAWAHVEIDPESAPKGATQTWRVPGAERGAERQHGQARGVLPHQYPIANVLVQEKPGWTFAVETQHLNKPIKTDDGTFSDVVTKVTWTAARSPPAATTSSRCSAAPCRRTPTSWCSRRCRPTATATSCAGSRPRSRPPQPENPAPTLVLTKAAKGG